MGTPLQPNAFTALRQGAKRRKSSAHSGARPADSQCSSFVPCPLCGAAIPRLLVQSHVDSCQGKAAEQPGLDKDTSTHQASDSNGNAQTLQKLPEEHQHQQHHRQLSSQQQQVDQRHKLQQKQTQQQQQQHPDVQHQPQQQLGQAIQHVYAEVPAGDAAMGKAQPTKMAAGNAFSALMAEQRQRSRVVVLHLERSPDNSWQVHCWTKGTNTQGITSSSSAPDSQAAAPSSKPVLRSQSAWCGQTQISSSVMQPQDASASSAVATKLTFQLQTNVLSEGGGSAAQLMQSQPSGRGFKGSASLLKSALQKNVRLCRAEAAVRCAAQLLADSPADFLRRVSIICLEDALLHPSLPVLVWLMCAQAKGYVLGKDAAILCLHIVHQLASVPVRDELPWENAPSDTADQDRAQCTKLGDEEGVLVQSILIRAAYGGMAGDVRMLQGCADSWTSRFRGLKTLPKASDEEGTTSGGSWLGYLHRLYTPHGLCADQLSLLLLTPLRYTDLPLSAVDFHISSIVEELLQIPQVLMAAENLSVNSKEHDAAGLLKRAMWLFRSGLNFKSLVAGRAESKQHGENLWLQPLWTATQSHADAWSSDYLHRRFA